MTLIQKGQSIELPKNEGVLPAVAIGLGWRKRESSGGFLKKLFGGVGLEDMDASCISYDAEKNPLDFIWFQNLGSTEDSIYHAGDDCTYTGNVNEPNEVIHVALGSLSGEISSIVFVVNSYAGETFADISSVFCNVVNKTTNDEVARYDLSTEGKDCNGFIIAKLFRLERQWFFSAIGELYSGGHCNLEEIEAQARTFA